MIGKQFLFHLRWVNSGWSKLSSHAGNGRFRDGLIRSLMPHWFWNRLEFVMKICFPTIYVPLIRLQSFWKDLFWHHWLLSIGTISFHRESWFSIVVDLSFWGEMMNWTMLKCCTWLKPIPMWRPNTCVYAMSSAKNLMIMKCPCQWPCWSVIALIPTKDGIRRCQSFAKNRDASQQVCQCKTIESSLVSSKQQVLINFVRFGDGMFACPIHCQVFLTAMYTFKEQLNPSFWRLRLSLICCYVDYANCFASEPFPKSWKHIGSIYQVLWIYDLERMGWRLMDFGYAL